MYGSNPETAGLRCVGVSFSGDWLQSPVASDFHYPWPVYLLGSNAYRYALLTFAAYVFRPGTINPDTYEYYGMALRSLGEACQQNSLEEVIVSSYAILNFAVTSEQADDIHLQEIIVYFKGLTEALYWLTRRGCAHHIITMMELLWRWSLLPLQGGYWIRILPTYRVSVDEYEAMGKLFDTFQWAPVIHSPQMPISLVPVTEVIGRINLLEVYLRFTLDYYLAARTRMNDHHHLEPIAYRLNLILDQIIDLVPRLPESRTLIEQAQEEVDEWPWPLLWPAVGNSANESEDQLRPIIAAFDMNAKRTALLFGLANVVKNAIRNDTLFPSSLLLARICAITLETTPWPCRLNIPRCLFWAGLGVTAAVDPEGRPFCKFI
jgi:hypothetical protein